MNESGSFGQTGASPVPPISGTGDALAPPTYDPRQMGPPWEQRRGQVTIADIKYEDPFAALPPSPPTPAPTGGRTAWVVAAVIGAMLLIGGGAFLAMRAATDRGGADSPDAVVAEMLTALEAEDFVTMATLVEPTERRTIIDPAFEIVSELSRLGVLSDDVDTSGLQGLDLEFREIDFTTEAVADDLVRVTFDGGDALASFDVSELPLGSLVTERMTSDELNESGTSTEPFDAEFAVVERDGRWYWSLWYSVGESIRAEGDEPFPNGRQALAPSGVESPELLFDALLQRSASLDIEGLIALVDPQEAAALYDYSPLFLADATEAVDEIRSTAESEGFSWSVSDVRSTATIDGDDASVVLEQMTAEFTGPEVDIRVEISQDSIQASGAVEGETVEVSIGWDGTCATVQGSFQGESIDESSCLTDDQMAELTESQRALAERYLDQQSALAARRVDGQWYLSPTSTLMDAVLQYLRIVDREYLEEVFELGVVSPFEAIDMLDGADPIEAIGEPGSSAMAEPAQLGAASVLALGPQGDALVAGQLAPRTYDLYELDLADGQSATIEMRSTDLDSVLVVIDGNGTVVAFNDDREGALTVDSAVDIVGPGSFAIEARSLDDTGSGDYTLEVVTSSAA